MRREDLVSSIASAIVAAGILVDCGGTTTTSTARHVDVGAGGDGSASVISSDSGAVPQGGKPSSEGTGGTPTILVSCNDGTGQLECCPADSALGGACGLSGQSCWTRCQAGYRGKLFCEPDPTSNTSAAYRWVASEALFPCRDDAGVNSPDAGSDSAAMEAGSCPSGAGPSMVRIPAPDARTYCIDSTEVTNRQYEAFVLAKGLATNRGVDTSGQDAWCSWNDSYFPDPSAYCKIQYDPQSRPDYPMVCIDWCDAFAYCKWAGKRLCGKIGGGANSYADYADATKSEWFNACSGGRTLAYPYGNNFNPTACNSQESGAGQTIPTASKPACEGGYSGLFDLSGNVWEWENSCQSQSGAADECHFRGGSYDNAGISVSCGFDNTGTRNAQYDFLGFRCCAP